VPDRVPPAPPQGEGLGRSVALLKAFRVEQTDPAYFYGLLAADAVQQLQRWTPLDGRRVLDVGGGPGFFRDAFLAAGSSYVSIDADLGELSAAGDPGPGTVLGSALALPVRTGSVDVCYSSNVLEHVPDPQRMGDEMVRVTRPGGLVYLSYTIWLGPWGGHETSPWHWLGGERAARRYERVHGKPPKNRYGVSMFPASAAAGLRWARTARGADLITAEPRYHPRWARGVVRVPGLREVVTWNLALVLRKR
jgi:SAM-dependent methyltransferase